MTAIFIAAVLCAEPASTSPIVKLTHTEVIPTFPVNLLNQQTRTTFSTGVVIARSGKHGRQHLILTCAHGKKKGDRQTVMFGGKHSIDGGYVVAIDEARDLAIVYLEADGQRSSVMKIVAADVEVPTQGTIVTVKGYGHTSGTRQQAYTERQTTVVGLQRLTGDGDLLRLRTKAEAKPGDSGGALIYKGKLIGITKAMSAGSKDVDSFFVTHVQINEFLKEKGFVK